jgi:hypothetical protein
LSECPRVDLMQASAEAIAQRAKEALEHTIASSEPAVNEVPHCQHGIVIQEPYQTMICTASRHPTVPCMAAWLQPQYALQRWSPASDKSRCAILQIKGGDKLFVLAVLPKGGVAAKNPE